MTAPDNPAPTAAMSVRQLRRIRWVVRLALTLGVAASMAANILHAEANPISQAIAGWPPVALLFTVELVSRVPVHHRRLALVRVGATVVISGIAAWVSYWHMTAVAHRFGETGISAYLLPISVDGLIVVASISLVELSARIRTTDTATGTDGRPSIVAGGRGETAVASVPVAVTGSPAAVGRPQRRVSGIGGPTR